MRRIVVHFDNEAVCACGDGRHCQRLYHPVDTCGMRRIDHNRQMAQALECRNCADIQRVSRVGFIGTDTALAENHIFIAFGHDIFGSVQPLVDGGG